MTDDRRPEALDPKRKSDPTERSKRGTVRKDAFLTVIVDMVTSIGRADVPQAAAAISYYSLFSLFPLLLFLVVFFSYFVDVAAVQNFFYGLFETFGPGIHTIIVENIQGIFENRASTSITAALTFLWSGSGAFSSIIKNVHNAWPESRGRGVLINRALAIFGILFTGLILGAILIVSLLDDLFDWERMIPILRYDAIRWLFGFLFRYMLPLLLFYLILYMFYRFIPATAVDREAARISSLSAIGIMTIFTRIFSAFLISPFNKYDAVYGSVTVIILLLLFIFVAAFIILCGAHLCAAITHYRRKREAANPRKPDPSVGSAKKENGKSRPSRLRSWLRGRRRSGNDFEKRWIGRIDAFRTSDAWIKFSTAVKNIFSSLFRWK